MVTAPRGSRITEVASGVDAGMLLLLLLDGVVEVGLEPPPEGVEPPPEGVELPVGVALSVGDVLEGDPLEGELSSEYGELVAVELFAAEVLEEDEGTLPDE
jgi:hypothetical protein